MEARTQSGPPESSGKASGHTLVETVIAMAVLTLGMLTLGASMQGGAAAQASSRDLEHAASAARRLVEELRGLPLESIVPAFGARSHFAVARAAGVAFEAPPGAPGAPDAGTLEICCESRATKTNLPSVLAEFGQDLDINADGDRNDAPDVGFRVLPVKITIRWRAGPATDRTYIYRTILGRRADE